MSSTASESSNVKVLSTITTANKVGKPTLSRTTRPKNKLKDFFIKTDKFLRDNPHLIAYVFAASIIFLYAWYYALSEKLAVSNTKIEFLQKKFDESETIYKENIQNELRIARCKNGAVLECYNKCNLKKS